MATQGTSIYKIWKDSTPVLPFPFQGKDKVEGKIVQTWRDVNDGISRDATNTALPFATGHFTPTSGQSEVMRELMVKEDKRRAKTREASKQRAESSQSGALLHRPPTAASSCVTSNTQLSTMSPGGAATPDPTRSTSKVRGVLISAQEKDALYGSEGRGRLAYLKLRRDCSVQHRFGERPRTTSQMYGWKDTDPAMELARSASLLAVDQPPKKKGGIGSLCRPRGVFPRSDFIGPNV